MGRTSRRRHEMTSQPVLLAGERTWGGRLAVAGQRHQVKAGTTDKGKMTQDVVTQPNVSSHAGISDLGLWTGGLGEPASASVKGKEALKVSVSCLVLKGAST